jgi:two-component system, chemotaxis family, protein-glutamate methylesterase/glutaminase
MSLKVLVADDSVLFRRVIAEVLKSLPDVEVVGSVSNGKLALQRVRELRPDILTLDMEMPEMDGMAVLEALREAREAVAVIVVSALTRQGGRLTVRALEKGAFDFITKPDTGSPEESREAIRRELAPRIRALANRLEIRSILRNKPASTVAVASGEKGSVVGDSSSRNLDDISGRMNRLAANGKPEMVLIGVSTGGPNALARIMPEIPGNIGVPLMIVQHMPPVFTQSLAESLSPRCAVRVREASHGEMIEANTAYIAPGGKQMRLAPGPEGRRMVQITDDPPENNCKPAVDYLFRSVANNFPGQAMAVILTGMGSDGTLGLRLLKRHGCYVIAQDEATCVVFGMPKAAADAGVTDVLLPLDAIAGRITSIVRGLKS